MPNNRVSSTVKIIAVTINAKLCPANIRKSLITLFIMFFLIVDGSRDRSRTDIYHLTYNVATKYITRDLKIISCWLSVQEAFCRCR